MRVFQKSFTFRAKTNLGKSKLQAPRIPGLPKLELLDTNFRQIKNAPKKKHLFPKKKK